MFERNDFISVIDLFAGPGGLGEGFSACKVNGKSPFRLALSIEKDPSAHQTLQLRAFYRDLVRINGHAPQEYYAFLRGEIDLKTLYETYPNSFARAASEARRTTLGELDDKTLDGWIDDAVGDHDSWVLIGGPPCQAYSTAGRARNRGNEGYLPEKDIRHFLYKEYLGIIARHWPPVFVMENVKGILSSKVKDVRIFERILRDLNEPARAVKTRTGRTGRCHYYRIYSLVKSLPTDLTGMPRDPLSDSSFPSMDFVIESEKYGIPQTRHRVILIGVRDDITGIPGLLSPAPRTVTTHEVIGDLPRLRSGLSRVEDTAENWREVIESACDASLLKEIARTAGEYVAYKMESTVSRLRVPKASRGKEFLKLSGSRPAYLADWFADNRLGGVCNYTTRTHMEEDLHRYLFAACFADVHGRSPRIRDFPTSLLPNHKNVSKAMKTDNFADRFRVQMRNESATTVVSHIAKDGHYYIHYDPSQCRSLTVREAARLQTFPDNYFFCGNRTEQYAQVGNAVPPFLALQIAEIVNQLLAQAETGNARQGIA